MLLEAFVYQEDLDVQYMRTTKDAPVGKGSLVAGQNGEQVRGVLCRKERHLAGVTHSEAFPIDSSGHNSCLLGFVQGGPRRSIGDQDTHGQIRENISVFIPNPFPPL